MGWWRDPPEFVAKVVAWSVVALVAVVIIALWWNSSKPTPREQWARCIEQINDVTICGNAPP